MLKTLSPVHSTEEKAQLTEEKAQLTEEKAQLDFENEGFSRLQKTPSARIKTGFASISSCANIVSRARA